MKKHLTTLETEAVINDYYLLGTPVNEIAENFGVKPVTIYATLRLSTDKSRKAMIQVLKDMVGRYDEVFEQNLKLQQITGSLKSLKTIMEAL